MATHSVVTARSVLGTRDPLRGESLEQLMDRFVAGDDAAFTRIYERVSPALLGKLEQHSRDREQARDVVQNTFLKLFRARDRYQTGAPVLPWIWVIAKRSLIDAKRPQSRRYEVLSSDGHLPENADTTLSDFAERQRLLQALDQLPGQYREAIELTKLTGLSGQEAANRLRTTRAAIKQRVHRGVELLRHLLSAPNGDDAALAF
jgi:RNA polymerase sigma-70 factor (ECF subfamily)